MINHKTNERDGNGPLSGLKVIDFGQYISGPAVAMVLADLGASVIRVERPTGPSWRSPAAETLNRGKQSIVLDLKTDAGLDIAKRLMGSADVVIENFRPGVMDRLGLGSESAAAANPALVYLSLPGFASSDDQGALPGWEGLVLAATGTFTDMGLNRVLMGISPSYTPLPLASAYASALGTLGVLTALYERELSGLGDRVEVSMVDAVLEGLAYNSLRVEDLPERYLSLRELEIQRRRSSDLVMDMTYEDLQDLLDPFYRSYECADGRMFYNCCPAHRTHAIKALKVLGLWEEFRDDIPLFDPYSSIHDWPDGADCTLLAYPLSAQWSDRISRRMVEVFKTRTSLEWEAKFDAAGIPGAAHRTTQEWIRSKHARQSGLMVETPHKTFGTLVRPGPIVWEEGQSLDRSISPQSDGDRENILESLKTAESAHTSHRRERVAGLALSGVRILDVTNVIAGPTVGATLARFGAEVIKIDPVVPTFDPYHNIVVGLQANRGKRSALVDLRTAPGQQILERLLAKTDIVVFNGTDRQLRSLGLSAERLREVRPDLALVRIDAYGGVDKGPRTDVPGYDDNVQACAGIMSRFGGVATPEEHAHLGTIDALAGFFAASAAVTALLASRRSGHGHSLRTSLASAGQFLQLPFMYDHPEREPFDEPSGRGVLGEHSMYRCFETSDGWLFVAGRREDAQRLLGIDGLRESLMDADSDDELVIALVAAMRRGSTSYWTRALAQVGIAAHRIEKMDDLRLRSVGSSGYEDGHRRSMSFVRHHDHPAGRWVDLVAPNAVQFCRQTTRMPSDAPRFGEHTREILAELGFGDADTAAMVADKIVADRWTSEATYLPL